MRGARCPTFPEVPATPPGSGSEAVDVVVSTMSQAAAADWSRLMLFFGDERFMEEKTLPGAAPS